MLIWSRVNFSRCSNQILFWIAMGVALLVTLLPVFPLLIHTFIPFPELNETTHWQGQVEVIPIRVEGNRIKREQLFILTADGRKHEFACGLFLDRYGCPRYAAMNGAKGEVWFSDTYGAVQWRLTLAEGWQKGKTEISEISEWKDYYQKHFRWRKYLNRLIWPLFVIAVAVWQMRRHKKSRP